MQRERWMRFSRFIAGVVGVPLRIASFGFLRMVSPARDIQGVEVTDFTANEENDKGNFSRIADAIGLIVEHHPRRWQRIKKDLRRVMITHVGGPEYMHLLRACVVNASHLAGQEPARIAMMLVHEATHARLRRLGFRYDNRVRRRIEQLCVKQEIAFAKRLPNSGLYVEWARKKLEREWWTDQKIETRRESELQALGCPAWLVRLRRRVVK